MSLGAGNVLYVGSMREGKVYALELDAPPGGRSGCTFSPGLDLPVGVAWRDGSLYVSAVSRIPSVGRHRPPAGQSAGTHRGVRRLPRETHHGWKFIAFGPDGWLHVPVGAPLQHLRPGPRPLRRPVPPPARRFQAGTGGLG